MQQSQAWEQQHLPCRAAQMLQEPFSRRLGEGCECPRGKGSARLLSIWGRHCLGSRPCQRASMGLSWCQYRGTPSSSCPEAFRWEWVTPLP